MRTYVLLMTLFMAGLIVTLMVSAASTAGDSKDGKKLATATFAGGCFWCLEPPFDQVPGVVATTVGYTGGHKANPTYEQVSSGGTGHAEAIQIVFDPDKVSYAELLEVFWRNIDPFDARGQFCDRGSQYRSAIFYHDEAQRKQAEQSRKKLEERLAAKQTVATEIVAATQFYPAEEYHQDYYQKNPVRYKFYRYGCGRDRRLQEIWGDRG